MLSQCFKRQCSAVRCTEASLTLKATTTTSAGRQESICVQEENHPQPKRRISSFNVSGSSTCENDLTTGVRNHKENMKKMAIVPVRMLEEMNRWKMEQRPRLPPSPQVTQTANLQKELNQTIENDGLSESEKAQKFGQVLRQFQVSHKKSLEPTMKPIAATPTPTEKTLTLKDRIMDSVPPTMRRKATLLLNMLENNSDLTWTKQGELEYNGKRVQGSNIIDLVNDVLRSRKGSNPKGWEQFAQGLRGANVPQEVVGNKRRWDWIQRQRDTHWKSDEEDEDEFYDSFAELPSSKKKKKRQSSPKKRQKHIKLEPEEYMSQMKWEPL